jgi:hypothetical protein
MFKRQLVLLSMLVVACGKQIKVKERVVTIEKDKDTRASCDIFKVVGQNKLPDFSKLKPIGNVKTDRLNSIMPFDRAFDFLMETEIETQVQEEFGMVCTGEFIIPVSNEYTFTLGADDGAKLFINDVLVINNDGLHSFKNKSVKLEMKEGPIKIRVEYFQNLGEKALQLSVKPQGSNLAELVIF